MLVPESVVGFVFMFMPRGLAECGAGGRDEMWEGMRSG